MRKIKKIEKKTGNTIRIIEDNSLNVDACIDFSNWSDMTKLPKILHKKDVDPVHILHELIHIETFFVDQYSLVATNDPKLHKVLDKFKNIPENYVAHKIICYKYNLDPIDRKWFLGKDNFGFPDEIMAANLINFYAFSEFSPKYRKLFYSFKQKCKQRRRKAYSMAEKAIQALNNMDYTKKESYNKCAEEIIQIFASNYYSERSIYLSFLSKEKNKWHWNP